MQTRVTFEEMQAAARQLARTENGRTGMKLLLEQLPTQSVQLGFLDRSAFYALLQAAWDGRASEVRDVVTHSLETPGSPGQ